MSGNDSLAGGTDRPDLNAASGTDDPNIVQAERLAVIALRGALKDAYQHGYREGMKRGQEMAAWGYMTPDGIAAARKKAEQKESRRATP